LSFADHNDHVFTDDDHCLQHVDRHYKFMYPNVDGWNEAE
jgi:hypothetical protein